MEVLMNVGVGRHEGMRMAEVGLGRERSHSDLTGYGTELTLGWRYRDVSINGVSIICYNRLRTSLYTIYCDPLILPQSPNLLKFARSPHLLSLNLYTSFDDDT